MKTSTHRIRRHLWKGAVVAAGVLLLWYGFRPRPVEVDVAPVARGAFEMSVEEDGETRIRDPYLITAPLVGRLVRVELEPGDRISAGQVIASIDPGEPGLLDARAEAETEARVLAFEAAHRRALSQLEKAKAEEVKAARYYERDQLREQKGEIAAPMVEDAEHVLRIARSEVSAAESAVDIAKYELDQAQAALLHSRNLRNDAGGARQFEIRSPINGVVLRRFQESSTLVPAAEAILEVGDPEDLEIRIDVLSEDAVKIHPGNRILIEHWGGPQALEGLVRRVDPSAFTKVSALGVDEQRVWVYGDFAGKDEKADAANPGEARRSGEMLLGDGYRIEARIIVSREEDVLKVPSGALFRDREPGKWAAYRVMGGVAELTSVERGGDNGVETRVRSGLDAGDVVILHPGDRIRPGTSVRMRER